MQRRRAGLSAASAIAASAVLLASCNAIFGLSNGTVGEPIDAPVGEDGPNPTDGPTPDMAIDAAEPDSMADGATPDAGPDGTMADAMIDGMSDGMDAMPDAFVPDAFVPDAFVPDAFAFCEPMMADEDGDGIEDDVDGCPHINRPTTDMDGDGAGDLCDPFMNLASQRSFIGFSAGIAPCRWTLQGDWVISGNGVASLTLGSTTQATILRDAPAPAGTTLVVVSAVVPPPDNFPGSWFAVTARSAALVDCWFVNGRTTNPTPDSVEIRVDGIVAAKVDVGSVADPRLELTSAPGGTHTCKVYDGNSAIAVDQITADDASNVARRPGVALAAGTQAAIRYVWVVEQP